MSNAPFVENTGQSLVPWWEEEKEAAHSKVFEAARALRHTQQNRYDAYLHYLRLYSNRIATSLSADAFMQSSERGNKIRLNVVKSGIDTAVAQNATARSLPLYATEGGTSEQRRRAKRLTKYVKGVFHEHKIHHRSLDVFRDAGMLGMSQFFISHLPPAKRGGKPQLVIEKVFTPEILIDDEDAENGDPTIKFRVKTIDRSKAKKLFGPKSHTGLSEEDIKSARHIPLWGSGKSTQKDPVTIVEVWQKPSRPGLKDGRHIICLSSATIKDEEWDRGFPFVHFHWNTPVRGFIGQGAAEELSPLQVEVNYIAQKIQLLMTLATTLVWKEKGSQIQTLNNKPFTVREYTGRPPIFQTVQAVSSEYFAQLDRLYQRMYELMGISQLNAQGQKPAGIRSAEGLRVLTDVGAKRFQHISQRWEQFFLDLGDAIIEESAIIIDKYGEEALHVLSEDRDGVERIKAADVVMAKDEYLVKGHPVSILQDTPAGKIDTALRISERVPQYGPYLIGMVSGEPDLEAGINRLLAPLRTAEHMVESILLDGKYMPPVAVMDLALTRQVATSEYLMAWRKGYEQDKLDMLLRFISEVDQLSEQQELEMQMAALQQAQAGQLGALPGSTTQPDILGLGPQVGPPGGTVPVV